MLSRVSLCGLAAAALLSVSAQAQTRDGNSSNNSSNPPGTAATRALDRAAGTNTSGAYPSQSDGTAANPSGTAVGRAADRATDDKSQERRSSTRQHNTNNSNRQHNTNSSNNSEPPAQHDGQQHASPRLVEPARHGGRPRGGPGCRHQHVGRLPVPVGRHRRQPVGHGCRPRRGPRHPLIVRTRRRLMGVAGLRSRGARLRSS